MGSWAECLAGDPLPWLLEDDDPAVKAATLRTLLGRQDDDPEVVDARAASMRSGPIAAILAAQHPDGYWCEPGAGYRQKYRGTTWQVVFLDQMGADGRDARIHMACEYVLTHAQTSWGGFGLSYDPKPNPPPPSYVIHCLNGNLLRALIGFGWLGNERVQRAVDWQTGAITGDGSCRYYASSTCAPGFCCAANDKLPCAWGAIKAMLALARIPPADRSPGIEAALRMGAEFLLSRDPAVADYPIPSRDSKPSGSWFRLGFPIAYITDVLQNLEALCALGFAGDERLLPAVRWLISRQDERGRWPNENPYAGKTWVDVDQRGQPSKWVTLRACRVVSQIHSAGLMTSGAPGS